MSTTKSPSLAEVLYSAHSIPDILMKYEKALRNTGEITHLAHAAKLAEYRNMITDKKFLYRIRQNFNGIYSLIDKTFPVVRFCIDGRRKSLISTEKKIQKLLSENKSLDLLRDLFAFRILIFGKNSQKLIDTCYSIAKKVIEYNIEKGLTLCEADLTRGTENFSSEAHPTVLLPKNSGIPEKFQYGVKDYISKPKENGYQSLHLTFRASTGECFEIQIRTFDMHVHAESGEANHSGYKAKKYPGNLTFDKSKINIPGYGISPEGDLFDFIGLEKGLEILRRQKTY